MTALCLVAPFVAALLGVLEFDLASFSGLRARIEAADAGAGIDGVGIERIVALQLASAFFLAPLLNAPLALGEEIGWRGYLLAKLRVHGDRAALFASGAAPLILLGPNYPSGGAAGIAMMTALCVVFGVIFGWLRIRTRSLWASVIAHAALNGTAGAIYLFHAEHAPIDPFVAGITGWSGLLLPAALAEVLLATLRRARAEPATHAALR